MRSEYIKGTLKAEIYNESPFHRRLLELFIRAVKATKNTLKDDERLKTWDEPIYAFLEMPEEGYLESATSDIWLTFREARGEGERECTIRPLTENLTKKEETSGKVLGSVKLGAIWVGEPKGERVGTVARVSGEALELLVNEVSSDELEELITLIG